MTHGPAPLRIPPHPRQLQQPPPRPRLHRELPLGQLLLERPRRPRRVHHHHARIPPRRHLEHPRHQPRRPPPVIHHLAVTQPVRAPPGHRHRRRPPARAHPDPHT